MLIITITSLKKIPDVITIHWNLSFETEQMKKEYESCLYEFFSALCEAEVKIHFKEE